MKICRSLASILFSMFFCCTMLAQNAIEDFDSLSRLSSEHLMESGRTYFEQRQASKALSCFTIVSERHKNQSSKEGNQLCIRALNNCGCVYKYFYFDYPRAYECFIQAYDLCEQEQNNAFLPIILVNLGDLLNDYGFNYGSTQFIKQASDLFKQCIDHAKKSQNWELLVTAFFNLANQDDSLDLKEYSIILSDIIPDSTPDIAYVRLQYKGMSCIQQHKYAEARRYFEQQTEVISPRWGLERDTLSTCTNIAKTYLLENNIPLAILYFEKTLTTADNNNISDYAAGVCKQLSDCYQKMGNEEKSRHYHQLYLEKMEETHNNRLSSIVELNYINQLKKEETKAQILAVRQQLQQKINIVIAILLLVVAISALLLWRQNHLLHLRNKILYEKYQQMIKAENKYRHSRLNDGQRETLEFRIQELLSNAELICKQDFSLTQLAKLADSNTTYVSQVINEKYGMTFSNVLGSFRIREACRRINESDEYENNTIEAIATSVGFKSRTAFINAFKREVGLTPSEYLKMVTEERSTTLQDNRD